MKTRILVAMLALLSAVALAPAQTTKPMPKKPMMGTKMSMKKKPMMGKKMSMKKKPMMKKASTMKKKPM